MNIFEKIVRIIFALGVWVGVNILIWLALSVIVPTWLKIIVLLILNGIILIDTFNGAGGVKDWQEHIDDLNINLKGSPQERAIYNQLKRNNKK